MDISCFIIDSGGLFCFRPNILTARNNKQKSVQTILVTTIIIEASGFDVVVVLTATHFVSEYSLIVIIIYEFPGNGSNIKNIAKIK